MTEIKVQTELTGINVNSEAARILLRLLKSVTPDEVSER